MADQVTEKTPSQHDLDCMFESAQAASQFLKALSHEGRLLILCHLAMGEKTVGQLEKLLDMRQAAVSQQLARLRLEDLVRTRRAGKTIYYRLGDEKVESIMVALHDMFCPDMV